MHNEVETTWLQFVQACPSGCQRFHTRLAQKMFMQSAESRKFLNHLKDPLASPFRMVSANYEETILIDLSSSSGYVPAKARIKGESLADSVILPNVTTETHIVAYAEINLDEFVYCV